MGNRLLSDIVSDGLLIAGDTSLTDLATRHLKSWLWDQAQEMAWSHLWHIKDISHELPANALAISIGGSGADVAPGLTILRVNKMMWAETQAGGATGHVELVRHAEAHPDEWSRIIDTTNKGSPSKCLIGPEKGVNTFGRWVGYFVPVFDKAYKIAVQVEQGPADPADSDKPWYPSDEVMIMVVKAMALEYGKRWDERAVIMDELDSKMSRVRLRNLSQGVANKPIQLNPTRFPKWKR